MVLMRLWRGWVWLKKLVGLWRKVCQISLMENSSVPSQAFCDSKSQRSNFYLFNSFQQCRRGPQLPSAWSESERRFRCLITESWDRHLPERVVVYVPKELPWLLFEHVSDESFLFFFSYRARNSREIQLEFTRKSFNKAEEIAWEFEIQWRSIGWCSIRELWLRYADFHTRTAVKARLKPTKSLFMNSKQMPSALSVFLCSVLRYLMIPNAPQNEMNKGRIYIYLWWYERHSRRFARGNGMDRNFHLHKH